MLFSRRTLGVFLVAGIVLFAGAAARTHDQIAKVLVTALHLDPAGRGDQQPVVLPELITLQTILEALNTT